MKILIADDHDLVRDMIGDVLSREAQCEVVAASAIDEVLRVLAYHERFDLILLDYHMPGMNELRGMKAVLEASRGTPVALISGVANRQIAEKALAAGAAGFIPKTMKAKSLINAIRFMASGEIFVPVDFMTATNTVSVGARALGLTTREIEVLGGLCEGLSNKEIGLRLDLKEVTVKLHVKTLTRKLGARNRTHAAMLAKEMALLPEAGPVVASDG
ncbi:response regulator transcription factor [Bauldia litoralis]|uniref:Two component transcriptional regulator, LuxR family n=1 Tax=Bauldia litoralis TaxID=665467 RepID=A0A1G6BX48_9HYPH|nr:response regulator transcription factor [Bauldia litoralis]SDB25158.1 two component transcriptional regulator, LuxR family [Bauldia litoralis]